MSIEISSLHHDVIDLHYCCVASWHLNEEISLPSCIIDKILTMLITNQHRFNYDLWHEEDKARNPRATDASIANVKRVIDALNQKRNNTIELIDQYLAEHVFIVQSHSSALEFNSETVGNIIDRLSILALKIYHMHEQTQRTDCNEAHIKMSEHRVKILELQRDDLCTALGFLINDIIKGKKQHKLYLQYKMYNDPTLNPVLYSSNSEPHN